MQNWNYSAYPYQQQSANYRPAAPVVYYQQPQMQSGQMQPQMIYQSQVPQASIQKSINQPQKQPQQPQQYQQMQQTAKAQVIQQPQQQYSTIPAPQIQPKQKSSHKKEKSSHKKEKSSHKKEKSKQMPVTILSATPEKGQQNMQILQSQIPVAYPQNQQETVVITKSPQKSLEERLQDLDRKLVETLRKSQEITKKLNQEINE